MVQLMNDSIYKPANIYLFTINNKNIRKRRAIRSALRIETPQRFTQSTLKIFHTFFSVSFVVDTGQVNVCWENIWWKKRKPQLSGNRYKSC